MPWAMERFLFDIHRLLDRLDVDPVLVLVGVGCVCEIDWSALSDPSLFPTVYRDGLLIVVKAGASLNRVLSDGSKKCHDGGEKVCPVYCKEFESRGMTVELTRAGWLRSVSDRDYFYGLPTL